MNPSKLALTVALLAFGCAHGTKDVFESEAVTATVDSRLEARHVAAVNGLYDTCVLRRGAWSVGLSANATLPHSKLEVLADEPACHLWLTDLDADEHYTATPPLDLNAAGGTTTFVAPSGASLTINAVRDPSASDGLVITLVETAAQGAVSGGSAVFAEVQSTVSDSTVEPSDYTFTFGLATPLTVAVDAKQVVVRATGAATLVAGHRAGDAYVVTKETFGQPVDFPAVTAAFAAGTARPLKSGPNELPAEVFVLERESLAAPVARTVIVTRAVDGVVAYQLVRITFGG